MRRIDPATLHGWLTDGGELALLDAREEGEFGASHLFWAVPCPLSRWEARVAALLPRLGTRIVCVDDGRGLAEQLADHLAGLGAADVSVLDGGTRAWHAADFVLFSGVNVPSKAFGEWVEHHYGTESVDAPELKSWLDAGRDMVVLDSRTYEEFVRMTIPGARSVPGGELVYRIGDLAPDPETLIVVNCAGRTRSIMGAESLRRAGVPNRVLALRNGTMGWELAGLVPERGRTVRFAPGRPSRVGEALTRAAKFAQGNGVGVIGPMDLVRFEEDPGRTCYVLDVRDPAEYREAHRAGSRNAPGGQLVQATDQWIGVRNARVVLIDDDGVRARMAAGWLRQMGHRDVFVAEGALAAEPAFPAKPRAPDTHVGKVPSIEAAALAEKLRAGSCTVVIDLARSIDFRDGHIPGAHWGVRTRLASLKNEVAGAETVVLTCPDGSLSPLSAAEAAALGPASVRVLVGGTAAWRAEDRPMAADRTIPADEDCIDFYLRPYDRNSGVAEAMQAYLSWEIELVRDIECDGTVHFGVVS